MKKIPKVLGIIISIILLTASVSFADNPIITNDFTADPAALVHNDTVYLYTGQDQADEDDEAYVINNWRCFSSTDMVNWSDEGIPLKVSDFNWASGDAWAGQTIYRNGKYYMYICAEHNTVTGKAIGVAVSDSPTGPFEDALGYPLVLNTDTAFISSYWDDIDPTVFIDDDGQAYLYWGNTTCMYAKLKSNMIEIDGSINEVSLTDFTEAPWIFKKDDLYYLAYASGWPEEIAYATSSSPTGPWTYQGIIMGESATCNTNHPSIIEFDDNWYFIYHNGALPTGGSYRRSVAVENLSFNSDGTIDEIVQTSTGIDGTMKRIQSYNYQDMYVRHAFFDAYIDSDVDPYLDSEWQIVPGLADSSYVSFQSVNYPGYYLRHSEFDFVLEKNDGSTPFAQDATFKIEDGLADSSWSSFSSYNYPARYIRHLKYYLKLEEISTTLDKQDATFKITD